VICEFDGNGKLRRKFLYGTGIDEPVRMSRVYKKADITGDGNVNIEDLRAMAAVWLDIGTNTADLNYDEKVNNTDSDILAANWLINSSDPSEEYYYYYFDGLDRANFTFGTEERDGISR